MPSVMPQEIDVWYVIPALRKELAKEFVKSGLKQREVAELLGVTEASVSHYIRAKRAKDIEFTASEKKIVQKGAAVILKDRKSIMKHLYALCMKLRGCGTICALHRKHQEGLPKRCSICKA